MIETDTKLGLIMTERSLLYIVRFFPLFGCCISCDFPCVSVSTLNSGKLPYYWQCSRFGEYLLNVCWVSNPNSIHRHRNMDAMLIPMTDSDYMKGQDYYFVSCYPPFLFWGSLTNNKLMWIEIVHSVDWGVSVTISLLCFDVFLSFFSPSALKSKD